MKLLRYLLWALAGAGFMTGAAGHVLFIAWPVALAAGLLASRLAREETRAFWPSPASLGAAIACLVLFGMNPEMWIFLLLWIALLIVWFVAGWVVPAHRRSAA